MHSMERSSSENVSVGDYEMGPSVKLKLDCISVEVLNTLNASNLSACPVNQTSGVSIAAPLLMFLFGCLGNTMALIFLHRSQKEVRKTVFYTLVAGLVWTDLIGQIMTSWVPIAVYANGRKWLGGEPLCKYHAFVMIAFGLLTPMIVAAMAWERFVALQFSFFYSRYITQLRARNLIIFTWIGVFLFATLPLIGFGRYAMQFPRTWCFLNFHGEDPVESAYAVIFAMLNIMLIITIVLCNIWVIVCLLAMRKRRRTLNSAASRHDVESDMTEPAIRQKQSNIELQMVVLLSGITVVFTVLWGPLMVQIMVNVTTGIINYPNDLIAIRLASINQILDPWVYILLRKGLIDKVLHYVKKIACCFTTSSTEERVNNVHLPHSFKYNTKRRFKPSGNRNIQVSIRGRTPVDANLSPDNHIHVAQTQPALVPPAAPPPEIKISSNWERTVSQSPEDAQEGDEVRIEVRHGEDHKGDSHTESDESDVFLDANASSGCFSQTFASFKNNRRHTSLPGLKTLNRHSSIRSTPEERKPFSTSE